MSNPRRKPGEIIDNNDEPCKGDFINAPLQGATKDYISPPGLRLGLLIKMHLQGITENRKLNTCQIYLC
jgi:hypothetical protein